MLAANAGFLIAFLAGYYLSYHTIPCIGIGISIVYMLGISFFPETPTYLLRHKKNGVTKTLYFYSDQTFSIEVDFISSWLKFRSDFIDVSIVKAQCQTM